MAIYERIGKRCLAVILIAATLSALCLFAGCGKKDRVTVTFDTQGGTGIAAQTVKSGETATEPQAPEKAGYVFAGWFCDGQAWSFADRPVTEDVTLTARWETIYVTAFGNTVTGLTEAGKAAADIDITPTVGGFAITKIEYNAFWDCKNMRSVTIPAGVTQIGSYAFNGCTALDAVYITDLAGWCGVLFVNAESNPLYYAHKLYYNGALLTDLTVPDGVTKIGRGAFYDCTSLSSVTVSDGVTEIGENAFSNCTALTTLTIGRGVRRIDGYAFSGCTNLSSVRYAGDVAGWCGIVFDSVYGNPLYYAHELYFGGERVTALTIPDGVYKIGSNAFAGCTSITSVAVGRDVRSIDACAFLGCSGITSVAFGSGVRSIGNQAFYNCGSLTHVTIGGNVQEIGSRAFLKCRNLTDITFAGTMARWNAIEKGEDWDALTGSYTVHCTDGDIAK